MVGVAFGVEPVEKQLRQHDHQVSADSKILQVLLSFLVDENVRHFDNLRGILFPAEILSVAILERSFEQP